MLVAIASAFLGGLILNLMPCVFPIISLKVLGLVRHGDHPARLRKDGLAFFAGVMATMLALSGTLIVARSGGAAIGWGFQLQSPIVIALLALIMLGAALNLAGLFEVGLSLQRVGCGVGNHDGAMGAALTGVLAIVVATPCSAPFMAGALGYALVQPALYGILIFAALAAGFAAPFTLLSLVPALAHRIPRPGAWMEIVKRAMAFPMFGAAAWLTWVLTQQTGPAGLAALLACAVALAFAGWLYGLAQRQRMAGRPFQALYLATGGVLALIAMAIVHPSGGIRTIASQDGHLAIGGKITPTAPVPWSPARLAAARATGKPILVNFTASWCITCQVNDKTTLSTASVREALASTGTTYMIADSTNFNADIEDAMAAFGRDGLPLYVVYPADGGRPVILPQILDKTTVISALDAAARKRI